MHTIIDYVNRHYSEKITSAEMSKLTGLTPHYFSNYFSKHTNITFRDYVNRVRLSHAADLLIETNLTIQEVSGSVGFTSQSYFTRLFSKQFDVSPLEYRHRSRPPEI